MSQRVSGPPASGHRSAPSPSTPETASGPPHPGTPSAPAVVCVALLVVAVLALAGTFIYACSTFD